MARFRARQWKMTDFKCRSSSNTKFDVSNWVTQNYYQDIRADRSNKRSLDKQTSLHISPDTFPDIARTDLLCVPTFCRRNVPRTPRGTCSRCRRHWATWTLRYPSRKPWTPPRSNCFPLKTIRNWWWSAELRSSAPRFDRKRPSLSWTYRNSPPSQRTTTKSSTICVA